NAKGADKGWNLGLVSSKDFRRAIGQKQHVYGKLKLKRRVGIIEVESGRSGNDNCALCIDPEGEEKLTSRWSSPRKLGCLRASVARENLQCAFDSARLLNIRVSFHNKVTDNPFVSGAACWTSMPREQTKAGTLGWLVLKISVRQ